jgi:thioredoxin-related protein
MTRPHLPTPASLPQAGQSAVAQGQPLVLMVSLQGCTACEWVRRAVLLPAVRANELQAAEIDMGDERRILLGFDGQRRTPRALAKGWGVTRAPTLLFLDGQGRELAERLVGLPLIDFYQAYLDERLQHARQQLRQGRVGRLRLPRPSPFHLLMPT